MKCICKISPNSLSLNTVPEMPISRYTVDLCDEKLSLRPFPPAADPLRLSETLRTDHADFLLQFLLYAFYCSFREYDSSTYQGRVFLERLYESDLTSLASIFQPLIVEKMPKGFSVIANISREKAAAFDKFCSMHQNGKINPILSDMIGSIQGTPEVFQDIYHLRCDTISDAAELSDDEIAFIDFLKEQARAAGYVFLPFPGLAEQKILESDAVAKLCSAFDTYIVSKSGSLYSQYILLK